MANASFFSDLLEHKTALLRRIVIFNAARLSSEKAAVLPLGAPLSAALSRHADLEKACFAKLEPARAQTNDDYCLFVRPAERLALLTPETLSRLALLAAAALSAEEIAGTLDRADVLKLREAIGEDIIEYALFRGRWQSGALNCSALVGALPGLGAANGSPLGGRILLLARVLLEVQRADWPSMLQMRTQALFAALTLPAAPQADYAHLLSAADRQRLWTFLSKLIHREIESEWPLFSA